MGWDLDWQSWGTYLELEPCALAMAIRERNLPALETLCAAGASLAFDVRTSLGRLWEPVADGEKIPAKRVLPPAWLQGRSVMWSDDKTRLWVSSLAPCPPMTLDRRMKYDGVWVRPLPVGSLLHLAAEIGFGFVQVVVCFFGVGRCVFFAA